MLQERAYSTVLFKAVSNEDQRIIEGIASTPTMDRDGDILEPEGASYALPMPLLWQHDIEQPVGNVIAATVSKSGVKIRAQFAKVSEPGPLKDRLDESWQSVKAGLVRGLSLKAIFKKDDSVPLSSGGRRVKKWQWLETSAVTIPANAEASISLVKSFDAQHRAKYGVAPRHSTAINLGLPRAEVNGHAMLPISEQLSNARASLTEKSASLQALMAKATEEDGLTDADVTERDTLTNDINSLTKTVQSLSALESATMATMGGLRAVTPITQKATETKPNVQVVELEKGIRFARVARAIAIGRGSVADTLEYAKRWRDQTPEVYNCVKAMVTKAVEGQTDGTSPGWGAELVYANNIENELIDLLRPRTIIGRISGFRSGVFNTRMVVQSGGSTVNWVEEGAVKPVTQPDFSTVTLPFHKIAGIVVLTQELVRLSNPKADAAVRDDLVAQIAQFMDEQFLDPTVTATAARPASITNGVASPAVSGTDADAFDHDLNAALATFDDDENTENIHILMTPALARGISTLRNAMGAMEFGALSARGGSIMGYPVIVSGSVPSGTIVLINPADILLADDGRVSLDSSDQATVDMAGGGSPNVSLWQRNLVGIRAERGVTWKKVRAESVAVIDTAAYGPSAS